MWKESDAVGAVTDWLTTHGSQRWPGSRAAPLCLLVAGKAGKAGQEETRWNRSQSGGCSQSKDALGMLGMR